MKSERWTIYCHTHIATGRRYIGLTKQTMMKRWKNHVNAAKSSKGGRWHFPNAIRKYGKDAFSHEVLEVCNNVEDANLAEEWWIRWFDTCNPERGFNVAKGGNHAPHQFSNPWDRPEYRQRAVESLKTRWQDPTYRQNAIAAQRKVRSDPEWRKKTAEISRRVHADPEVKERHAEALRGRKLSAEHCAKISENLRERASDPEEKERRSEMSKSFWERPGFRERQSEAHRGKRLSAETRAKISANSTSSRPEVRAKISASLKERKRREREGTGRSVTS